MLVCLREVVVLQLANDPATMTILSINFVVQPTTSTVQVVRYSAGVDRRLTKYCKFLLPLALDVIDIAQLTSPKIVLVPVCLLAARMYRRSYVACSEASDFERKHGT